MRILSKLIEQRMICYNFSTYAQDLKKLFISLRCLHIIIRLLRNCQNFLKNCSHLRQDQNQNRSKQESSAKELKSTGHMIFVLVDELGYFSIKEEQEDIRWMVTFLTCILMAKLLSYFSSSCFETFEDEKKCVGISINH